MSPNAGAFMLLLTLGAFQFEPLMRAINIIPTDAPPLGILASAGLFTVSVLLLMLKRSAWHVPNSLFLLLSLPVLHLPVAYFAVSAEAFAGGARLAVLMMILAGICGVCEASKWDARSTRVVLGGIDLINVVSALAVIHSAISPAVYEGIGEVQSGSITRAFGITGDPAGWIMAFATIIALSRRKMGLASVYTVALLATGQVGALLMMLFGAAGITFARGGMLSRSFKIAATIAIAAVLGFTLAGSLPVVQRLQGGVLTEEGGSASLRLFSMALGLEMALQAPVVGSGYGTYTYVAAERHPDIYDTYRNYLSNSANQTLQWFYEFGALFSAAALYLTIRTLSKLRRAADASKVPWCRGVFLAIVAMAVVNQSAVYFLPSGLFAMMLIYVSLVFASQRTAALVAADQLRASALQP